MGIIGGGLLALRGTASPSVLASAPEGSVSMFVTGGGGGSPRSQTLWSALFFRSSGVLISAMSLLPSNFFEAFLLGGSGFGVLDLPSMVIALNLAFNSCKANLYVPYREIIWVFQWGFTEILPVLLCHV